MSFPVKTQPFFVATWRPGPIQRSPGLAFRSTWEAIASSSVTSRRLSLGIERQRRMGIQPGDPKRDMITGG